MNLIHHPNEALLVFTENGHMVAMFTFLVLSGAYSVYQGLHEPDSCHAVVLFDAHVEFHHAGWPHHLNKHKFNVIEYELHEPFVIFLSQKQIRTFSFNSTIYSATQLSFEVEK